MITLHRHLIVAMSSLALAGSPLVAFAQPAADASAHAAGATTAAPAAAPAMANGTATAPANMTADATGEAGSKTVPACDKDMTKHCNAMGHKHKKGGRHHHRSHKQAHAVAE